MSILEALQGAEQDVRLIYGVVAGIVTNNHDPDELGRVKLRFPWLSDDNETDWVRIATLMTGANRGSFFLPETGDEVLVAFEHGDINHPFVIGMLWNGTDAPPEANRNGKNNIRLIKSRSGHKVILDDTDGGEKIEVIDKSGNNFITIDTANNTIEITSNQDIKLSASNGKISLDAMEIEIKSSANTKIEAGANADLKATGNTTVKGAMVMVN